MKALVTGGGGFLGKAIGAALVARGDEVVSFSRGDYPELAALGIDHRRGDIADAAAVTAAAEGCDIVFHTAALPGIWGPYERYFEANVLGTRSVLQACRAQGITKLVHTSSPSVVHCGRDLEGVDESQPYGEAFHAHYPATKAISEKEVLAANSPELATVALRPHLIWGPGDHHIIPRLIARAKAGKLRRIGPWNKKVDTIYIDNCADAHLLAAEALAPGAPCAGKAYFLSQDDPRPCWDTIDAFLEAGGAPRISRKVPYAVAWTGAFLAELVFGALGREQEPPLTRFVVEQFTTAHWFDISAAKRDLGYAPKVSMEEGLARLRESLAQG